MNTDRPFLLDLSRLVWRAWSGRLPTGIDRVCLAYLDHFAPPGRPRAQAIVKRGERRLVLSPGQSDTLFALLRKGGRGLRPALALLLIRASLTQFGRKRRLSGKAYLNIGHTGLDAPGLPAWLKAVGLTPIFLIHDLIPITHPEFCRAGEAARHAARMRHALIAAAGIIANSAATRDALAEFAAAQGLPMPPTSTAPQPTCPRRPAPIS